KYFSTARRPWPRFWIPAFVGMTVINQKYFYRKTVMPNKQEETPNQHTLYASEQLAGVNVMSGDEQLHTISVLVENQPGVLARVAHVFARRGFNIESLAVSRTEDPTVSRMTIVVAGNDAAFEQMGKQI